MFTVDGTGLPRDGTSGEAPQAGPSAWRGEERAADRTPLARPRRLACVVTLAMSTLPVTSLAQAASPVSVGPAIQVIADPGLDIDPLVSADGKRVIFASSRTGHLELWARTLGAAATFQLTTSTSGSADRSPSLTPDGKTIVFQSDRVNGARNVWMLGVDNAALAQLTAYNDGASRPRVSPDAKSICFTRTPPSGTPSIWIMNADGASPRQLRAGIDCAWSSDGKQLYFSSNGGQSETATWELWAMTPDGSNAAALTSGVSGSKRAPAVSPDGAFLAFANYPDGFSTDIEEVPGGFRIRPGLRAGIWIMDLRAPTRRPQPLVDDAGFNGFPAWAPDSKEIFFTSTRGGSADIYRMAVRRP